MHAPALVLALPLAAGVAIGALAGIESSGLVLCVAGACWTCALVALTRRWALAVVCGCAAGLLAIGVALGGTAERRAIDPPLLKWFRESRAAQDPVRITGWLRDDAASTGAAVSATIEVEAIAERDRTVTAPGGVRVSIGGALAVVAAREWRAGRRITAHVTLRPPLDYRDPGVPSDSLRLARQGIVLLGTVKSAALVEITQRGSWLSEAGAALRAIVRRATTSAIGPWSARSAGVVTAILIGDRSGLDPEDERKLQDAGTYHVIAISGGNIALLMMLLVAAGRAVRLPARAAAALSIVLLAFYGYTAGLAPSVLRATVAGVIYLFARVLDHRGAALNALAVAGAFAGASAPLTVIDPGFILSFGATAGIIVGASRLLSSRPRDPDAGRLARISRYLLVAAKGLGAATLCAEVALAPIAARLFARISLAGLVLNFIAIPLMGVIQFAGLAVVALQAVAPPLALGCGFIAHLATTALLASASLVDAAPWTVRDVPPPAWWVLLGWYGGWVALLTVTRRRVRQGATVLIAACAAVLLSAPRFGRAVSIDPPAAGWTRIVFIDVGQGDAALVSPPGLPPLLVDAGGVPGSSFDLGRRVTVPVCWAFGTTRLSRLILTHADPDHIGGAPAVIRALRPREVIEGVPVPPHLPLQQVHALAVARHARWTQSFTGAAFDHGPVSVRILHPPPPDWERRKVRNDDSLVLELRIGEVALVLPGDISAVVEPQVATQFTPAPLVIVKAPHHGSAGSSSPGFVAALRPAAVVFSAGRRNSFGHPSPAIIDRYRAGGAAVFRTDEDGAVVADTDGHRVVIWTWMGKRLALTGLVPGTAGSDAIGVRSARRTSTPPDPPSPLPTRPPSLPAWRRGPSALWRETVPRAR